MDQRPVERSSGARATAADYFRESDSSSDSEASSDGDRPGPPPDIETPVRPVDERRSSTCEPTAAPPARAALKRARPQAEADERGERKRSASRVEFGRALPPDVNNNEGATEDLREPRRPSVGDRAARDRSDSRRRQTEAATTRERVSEVVGPRAAPDRRPIEGGDSACGGAARQPRDRSVDAAVDERPSRRSAVAVEMPSTSAEPAPMDLEFGYDSEEDFSLAPVDDDYYTYVAGGPSVLDRLPPVTRAQGATAALKEVPTIPVAVRERITAPSPTPTSSGQATVATVPPATPGTLGIAVGSAPEKADAITRLLNHMSAPKPKVRPFSGDPTDYHRFKGMVDNRIVRLLEPEDRVPSLLTLLEGRPKRLVEASAFEGREGFRAAMNLLDKEYGDPQVLVKSYVDLLCKNEGKALGDIVLEYERVKRAMEAQGKLGELSSSFTLLTLTEGLPKQVMGSWNKVKMDCKAAGREITYDDLLQHLKDQEAKKGPEFVVSGKGTKATATAAATVAATPASAYSGVRSKIKRAQGGSAPGAVAGTSRGQQGSCECCSSNHALQDCKKFSSMAVNNRYDVARTHQLCYRCLGKGHSRANCPKPVMCTAKDCRLPHHPFLHKVPSPFYKAGGKRRFGAGKPANATSGAAEAPATANAAVVKSGAKRFKKNKPKGGSQH